MSIERNTESIACFCGKGTIVRTWSIGDWPGQGEEGTETMNCPICEKLYEYRVISIRSDDHSAHMEWVKK